jgi:uncharacterized protein (DUF111 family)
VGSRSDEVNDFFILPNPSNRTRPCVALRVVRKADNFDDIFEPIVYECGILNISQPCRPARPLTFHFTILHKTDRF